MGFCLQFDHIIPTSFIHDTSVYSNSTTKITANHSVPHYSFQKNDKGLAISSDRTNKMTF